MKKTVKITAIILVCFTVLSLGVFAKSDAKITAAYGTPVIDGGIDAVWADAEQQSIELVDKEVKPSDSETTGKLRTMWDENYFYVLVEVDKHGAPLDVTAQLDSADICMTLNGNFEANLTPGGSDYAGVIRVNGDGTWYGYGALWDDVGGGNQEGDCKGVIVATSKSSYLVEYAVPWSDIEAKEGNIVSLDIQVNDFRDGAFYGIITWAATPCYCWQDSYEHGTVVLGAKPVETTEAPATEASATQAPVADTSPETPAAAETSDSGMLAVIILMAAAASVAAASKKHK